MWKWGINLRKVAIVGRPNVGKSALFNRLVGRREAIVDDQPGVTRDVKGVRMEREETGPLLLLDTGGLWSGDRWEKDIQKKVAAALEDVELVLFCVDGRSGLTAGDLQVAGWLREGGYEALLVATKLDDPNHEETADFFELYSLGLGEPLPTSAEHNRGIYELLDEIALRLPPEDDSVDEEAVRAHMQALTRWGCPAEAQRAYRDLVARLDREMGMEPTSETVRVYEAAMAAAYGLPFEQALATVTIDAARILGIADRVGSLEKGKDGDVAIFDGDPFEYTSRVCGVVIEGQVVSETCR